MMGTEHQSAVASRSNPGKVIAGETIAKGERSWRILHVDRRRIRACGVPRRSRRRHARAGHTAAHRHHGIAIDQEGVYDERTAEQIERRRDGRMARWRWLWRSRLSPAAGSRPEPSERTCANRVPFRCATPWTAREERRPSEPSTRCGRSRRSPAGSTRRTAGARPARRCRRTCRISGADRCEPACSPSNPPDQGSA